MAREEPEPTCFGQPLLVRADVDSTNLDLARRLREQRLPSGTVLRALRQTHGRGTAGRPWYSDSELGLWFSLLLRPPLRVRPLSFLPAIAAVDLLRDDLAVPAHLKWPNDILVEERKLGGILVESIPAGVRSSGDAAREAWIVGVGLNVDQMTLPEPIAATATSLRLITGRTHDCDALLRVLLQRMQRLWDAGIDLVQAWPARSQQLGRQVDVRIGSGLVAGTAESLTSEGHLVLRLPDGRRQTVISPSQLG